MKIKDLFENIVIVAACVILTFLGYVLGIAHGIWSQQDLENRKTEETIQKVSFGIVKEEDEYEHYKQIWFQYNGEDYRIVLPIKAN